MKHNQFKTEKNPVLIHKTSDQKTICGPITLLLVSCFLLMFTNLSWGQLSTNDFNFSGNLTANGWTAHSAGGTTPIATTGGLTYAGFPGSGVGNAAQMGNAGGEDDNITFASQNTNGQDIYMSCMINVNDAATSKAGDYFLHLGTPGGATFTLFAARVFAKITASAVNFGISNTSTATYGPTSFAKNTTYLLVVKYTINTGGNDNVSLWVISSGVPATEVAAGPVELTNTGTAGQDAINAIGLRQGSNSTSPQVIVDGIRVGTSWADVTGGINDQATLANISQPSGDLLQNTSNAVLSGFTVTSNVSHDFTQVTVTNGGNATSSDISNFRIFRDQGTIGVIDGGDASVSGAGVAHSGSIVFNITGETGVTTTRNYLIIADVSPTADVATPHNISASVGSGAFVTGAPSNVGSATGNLRNFSATATPLITLTGTLTPFTTTVGTPSATQSYTVTGANLLGNITVTPPTNFKIRKNADAFASTPVTLTPGEVASPKTIDVQYDPASAGSTTDVITHTSSGAVQKDEAVTGSSFAGQPTTQSTVTFGAITQNSAVINFSGGDGANRIVVVRNASAVNYAPTDGFAATGVNSFYFAATDKGSGNKIVYDGSGNTVTVTGLDATVNYHVAVYEYNGSAGSANYLTASPGINNTTTTATIRVPVPMASQGGFSYTADFNDEANWGNDFNFGIGSEHWTSVGVINLGGNIPDPLHTTVSTASFITTSTSGGLQRGSLAASGSVNVPGTLVQLSTNATDNVNANAIDLLLDFTGVGAGTLTFKWAVVFNSTGDRPSTLRVYGSPDGGTTFTEITAARVENKANNVAASGTISTVALPATFSNNPNARLRFYEHNGTGVGTNGSRAKISIDDVIVAASVPPTKLAITDINPDSPTQNSAFSITVQSQDNTNTAQNVLTNTDFTITKNTGTGTLTGTVTGTILAGTNSVVVSGLLYDVAEMGVSLRATRTAGDNLAFGNSAAFEVITPQPTITLTGTLNQFLTGVGTQSAPQSYQVSGQFLQGDIIITPPPHFKIRTGANPFSSNPINLTPSSGTVNLTTIDVVYTPTNSGPHNNFILHQTTNGDEQNLAVSGNTSAGEPTTASTVTFGCPTTTSIVVNFTGGNGTNRIVVARAGSAVSFTPVDGTPPSGVNSDFSAAANQGSGNKIVYDGNGSTVTISNLATGTSYFVAVYEYNGSGSITNYLTSSFGSGDNATLGTLSYGVTASTYSQDFDGLPSTGTFPLAGTGPFLVSGCPINASNASGWQLGKAAGAPGGTGPNATFIVNDGSGTGGSAYSYGAASDPDRALGTLASGAVISSFGTALVNNTSDVLQKITITYVGEQWRNGGSSIANTLTFSYSLNGTDIFTGTYTPVPALNYTSTVVGAVPAAVDGNTFNLLVSNTFTLEGNWLPGQTLVLRWDDANDGGADDGLAVDNFTFKAEPPVAPITQDNNISFTSVSTTSLTANWINGDGANHLVKVNTVNSFTNPVDFTGYGANDVYGGGEQVVFNGTGSSVSVTNLNPGTQYFFRVYGYNGTGASSRYNTATATLNPNSVTTQAASPPTKLVFISVNGGVNVIKNQAFSVVIQSQDNANNPQIVNQNTNIDLSVFVGSGDLSGGTTSGTILAGTNQVTISGVKYNVAETGVQLNAHRTSGNVLADGQSAEFDVDDVADRLKFTNFPANGVINTNLATFTVTTSRPDLSVDPNYVGSVTLSINSGPGAISGTLTQPVVSGSATFNDIQLNTVGAYTLKATAAGLTQDISSTITITATPVMTELVVPKYMGSRSGASTNTNRTPIAVCLQIDNLVPNTAYDIRTALDNIGDGIGFYGAGNVWNGTAFAATNIQNAFTTNGSGSSGPFWVYYQPTGNASNFGGNQVHSVRVGYAVHGNPTQAAPAFIGTKQITSLDIANTALTATSGDDGAFLTGVVAPCAAGKYVLIYDNTSGTGNPVYSYQARQAIPVDPTPGSYSGLPDVALQDLYQQQGVSVNGEWPAVIPIGANNPNGIRRVEVRNADNTIFGFETDADGIWPGGANTLTATKRAHLVLSPTDAPISTVVTNLNPATGTPGTPVIISGAHFTGTSSVDFNGTAAVFNVINDNQINTTVPAGATDGNVTVTNGACSSGLPFDVAATTVTLTSNILIEGYYLGGGLMNNPLFATGGSANPLDCDFITISAMQAGGAHALVNSQTAIIKTNGNVSVTFGAAVIPNTSYYIRITHRNGVTTWSKNPVMLTSAVTYIFSDSPTKAFGDNMVGTHAIPGQAGDGFGYAIYSGDIWDGNIVDSGTQDGSVDATDFLQLDPHIQNGDGGYLPDDISGDGSVDATDFLWLDPNIQNGVGAAAP